MTDKEKLWIFVVFIFKINKKKTPSRKFYLNKKNNKVACGFITQVDTGQRCVPVLFWLFCPLIGRPMIGLRLCHVWSQLSDE
jgi:hypothetical protein